MSETKTLSKVILNLTNKPYYTRESKVKLPKYIVALLRQCLNNAEWIKSECYSRRPFSHNDCTQESDNVGDCLKKTWDKHIEILKTVLNHSDTKKNRRPPC